MQKKKSKSLDEHRANNKRMPFLTDAQIELLDNPSINLYKMLMKWPADENLFVFDEYYELAFGQNGNCTLDIASIKGLLLHDWLEACVIQLFCM